MQNWRVNLVTTFAAFGMCYGALVEIGVESDPELIMGYVLRATLACTVLGVIVHGLVHSLLRLFKTWASTSSQGPRVL